MATIRGTERRDTLFSRRGDDLVFGLGGNDTVVGSSGNDAYDGGPGRDLLLLPVALGDGALERDPATGVATAFSFGPTLLVGAGRSAFADVETVAFLDGSRVEFAPDAAAARVVHLYRFSLGRDPDAYGLSVFAGRLEREGTEAVARALAGSEEAARQPRLAVVGENVDRAYAAILGRAPGAEERAFWVGTGLDDGALAASLLDSAEYDLGATGVAARGVAVADAEAVLVARGYAVLLGRAPDLLGAAPAVLRLKSGEETAADLYGDLAASAEFALRRGGPLSDADFVDLLYSEALGRAADAGGRDFWTARLASGEDTRGAVAAAFVTGPEGYAALDALAASGVDLL